MASSSKLPTSSPPRLPPPPPGLQQRFPYDVFLSFKGADTRNTFIDHLYTALVDSGIHTFRDDDELNVGGVIKQELMTAIGESRIAIVVFSENYAFSSWCLEELERIIVCKETTGKMVLPVFYHVDPSDVRKQSGSFAVAFQNHEARYANELDKVDRWRFALTYASNLSGLSSENFNWSESGLIKQIVKEVLFRGKIKKMFVAKHPVGLDSHLNVIIPSLIIGTHDVRLIGISGMGGIGKTVIATALYNETLRYFDSSCFLENIREVSARPNGLESLQEQLLYQLSMKMNLKVGSVRRGIEMIKEMFSFKKVLIVLDDLDNSEQANALAGCHDWFGPGSRIIVTTRHEKLLRDIKVDTKYFPQELNYDKSLELFSLHSFESKSPPQAYVVPAKNFADYCRGLPLALQVLGSYLSGKDVSEWNSAFVKLQQFQPDDIHEKLKISYDGLDDDNKEIFLDTAFFFIGMDIDYVTEILNGCGFNTTIGIRDLRDRCLITVNRNNELRMHDLLRDMGREIVRRLFPRHPYKRSRLWIPSDVTEVLVGNKEAEAVEGVVLMSPYEKDIHLHTKMPNLRLLQMNKVNLKGDFQFLSCKLRWICWQEYSLYHLPPEMQLINIVALDMQHSKMVIGWLGIQFLEHLKILNLSHSKCLSSIPGFTLVRNLATLILEGCTSLLKIHQTIGCLASLKVLNLKDCKKITAIPREICSLRVLEYLNLNGCSKLEGLPENLGEIETLRELYADETAIKQLPPSLGLLKNLTNLSLKGCNKKLAKRTWFSFFGSRESSDAIRFIPPSISGLSALRMLNLRDCNLSDQDIPVDMGSLYALQELDLAGNSLSRLPESFNQLTNLESLYLDNWNDFCSLPALSPSLRSLVQTTSRSCPYDVFLSFSGLNTRDTFTDHLYTALVEAGIYTFTDDELDAGGTISHELMPAIEESRIAIIVLSTNYATSTWCLDNLVRIIKSKQTKGKVVLPIFYHVDQTDVSSQIGTNFRYSSREEASQIGSYVVPKKVGSYAEAFQKHVARYVGELDKVERWRSALSYTAGISGWSLQDFNGSESSLINHIVKEVQWELKRLFVAKNPVGLESRLNEVRSLLKLELGILRLIEIRGRVGSGKTVIAKALYNETLQLFDSSCFLADIGEVSARPNGLVYLQNQLLYQLSTAEKAKVDSVAEGIEAIRKVCRHKKVLIVFDGFNDIEQAYALLGHSDWYGPGSRIIIVIEERSTLHCEFQKDECYITEWLKREESLELLSWHSFGRRTLPTDYAMLADKLIRYCEGNPLAVVVLGIYLCGRSITEWNSAVQRTQQLPEKEIYEIHNILFDDFDFYDVSRVFVSIAYVIQIFNGCGVNSDFGIKFLLDKCLPTASNWGNDPFGGKKDWGNDPRVQDLLQVMGFRSPFP